MPFLNGLFTRIRQCVNDASASPPINNTADRMDLDLNDIAGGLSNAVLRDGTSLPQADIPWNGKRITGLGAAKSVGDALSAGSVVALTNTSPNVQNLPLNSYTVVGTLSFTAGGTGIIANGTAFCLHDGTYPAPYVCLMFISIIDTTTGNAVVNGPINEVYCNPGNQEPLFVMLATAGLVIGRTYNLTLNATKNTSGGYSNVNFPSLALLNI